MSHHRVPALVFAPGAWQKMLTYAQLCPLEVSGWAYVEVHPDFFYVGDGDVFIVDQEVTSTSVDRSGLTDARADARAMAEGRDDALRLQWHSHIDDVARFSATDTGDMDALQNAGATWRISVVLNRRGRVSARWDNYREVRVSRELPVQGLGWPVQDGITEACAADLLDHVTIKPAPKATKSRKTTRGLDPDKLAYHRVHPYPAMSYHDLAS